MNCMLLLEMAAQGYPDRVAITSRQGELSYRDLVNRAAEGAGLIRSTAAQRLVYVSQHGSAFIVALYAAAWAGVPLVPLNYRLGHVQLEPTLLEPTPTLFVGEGESRTVARSAGAHSLTPERFLRETNPTTGVPQLGWSSEGRQAAVILGTSGTTSTPKQAILRHRHLVSYVMDTVEFGSSGESEGALVTVPPYHIAGVANTLTNVYACRRIVVLDSFTPEAWLRSVQDEGITSAVVVPTMLARIVEFLSDRDRADVPTLRSLIYGGARMPVQVLERALNLFPATDFVNAYGLTETSSTVALLDGEDHRLAIESDDPTVRATLSSVGRPIPGIDVEIRGKVGERLRVGQTGEVWLRGDQISGEYIGQGSFLDPNGWYPTRDMGRLDARGYLFIEGRSDDTIIRGGENIAPMEIEEVIRKHPSVQDVAVVGKDDEEWGQRIAAAVVLHPGDTTTSDELREWVRERLRSSKTPDEVVFKTSLPYTDTGKLVRRDVLEP